MTIDNAAISAAVPRPVRPCAAAAGGRYCRTKHPDPAADGEVTCRIQAITTPRGRQRACRDSKSRSSIVARKATISKRSRSRSEERRVGKECSTRWATYHCKKKEQGVVDDRW